MNRQAIARAALKATKGLPGVDIHIIENPLVDGYEVRVSFKANSVGVLPANATAEASMDVVECTVRDLVAYVRRQMAEAPE